MEQVVLTLSDGRLDVLEVPEPKPKRGSLLIETTCTLVSPGTERMLTSFGKANILQKARTQPDKVKQVVQKIQSDGLAPTLEAVRSKLDTPTPLGYCNVGRVLDCGGAPDWQVGDRVASNGLHAGVVLVPRLLCAKIPDSVSDSAASFTVLAAVALQGIRLAAPTLGECVAVIGLGTVGLLAAQMLQANGCQVIGIDPKKSRRDIAESFGVITLSDGAEAVKSVEALTAGRGADAVLVTAATTSSTVINDAAAMSRVRGRIVQVGVTGLNIKRPAFYEKELTLQVSCSYGPGRYDKSYEEEGSDYPFGFVRWTQQRNFEAVLMMMARGQLNTDQLITSEHPVSAARHAMDLLEGENESLGLLLKFEPTKSVRNEAESSFQRRVEIPNRLNISSSSSRKIGIVGAGNYASRVLIPNLIRSGGQIRTLVSAKGLSATFYAKKYAIPVASSDLDHVLNDRSIDAVVIATPHGSHADIVIRALEAEKHVFCEKPLATDLEALGKIRKQLDKNKNKILMVGFNRRYAKTVLTARQLLGSEPQPKVINITVNAGPLPAEHWMREEGNGGGRLNGEVCHFIDLARFLVGCRIKNPKVSVLGSKGNGSQVADTMIISLEFEDGSLATISYLANGNASYPKERVEAFAGGKILKIDNYRTFEAWGWGISRKTRVWKDRKGVRSMLSTFLNSIESGNWLSTPPDELLEITETTIKLSEMVSNNDQ